MSKDSIVVPTLIAWTAIITSVSRVSQDLQTKMWHRSSTLLVILRFTPLGSWAAAKKHLIMKKVFLFVVMLAFSAVSLAQTHVTRFLGIPVDGSKEEMIQKLKAKGFTISPYKDDVLVGEFNGMNVNVHIATNNNKVYRIMVCDANTQSAGDIRIRFNNLCRQFEANNKYIADISNSTIPDDEDISYEILVHDKRYQAGFYQLPAPKDTVFNKVASIIGSKYTKEELLNMPDEQRAIAVEPITTSILDKYSKNLVWFTIGNYQGKYYIIMYYDNKYNEANGEDL